MNVYKQSMVAAALATVAFGSMLAVAPAANATETAGPSYGHVEQSQAARLTATIIITFDGVDTVRVVDDARIEWSPPAGGFPGCAFARAAGGTDGIFLIWQGRGYLESGSVVVNGESEYTLTNGQVLPEGDWESGNQSFSATGKVIDPIDPTRPEGTIRMSIEHR